MRGKRYTEPPIGEEAEGYKRGGRKRRKSGGLVASGTLSEKRLDSRPRRSIDDAVNGRVLPPPIGDRGAPLPAPLRSTRPSSPPSIDEGAPQFKRGGRLTAAERHALPGKDFALPGERYPIPDASHGRNALARVSQFGSSEEKAKVRAAVHRKFPEIGEG